jgi:hypothetical protein
MKRNEIIVYEHKKGVRAVKYNKKPQTTIEPPKPTNPVAKNANAAIGGGAAGAHKNEKKASQSVRGQKHKNAEMAEGSEFGAYYYEKVAQEIFNNREDISSEDEVLNQAYKIVANDRGQKSARYMFNYDEDFPSDLVSAYFWLQKNQQDVEEGYGSRNPDLMSPNDYDRYQQDQMDYDKRSFKRAELQHELGHEDDPNFERKMRQQQMDRDRGPWFIKINGKILKVKGEPKVFDWKKGANNYALAVLKNKPELQGKIMLTKKGEDDVAEAGQEVGTISKVDPMTKKATVTKSDGSSMEIDSSALKPTPDGKMQMDVPDSDEMKSGTKVVSTEGATEEEMMAPPTDSSSPIPGDNDHDEISKLLVKRLRRLAGL